MTRKTAIFLSLIIIATLIIPLLIYTFRNQLRSIIFLPKVEPKLINQTTTSKAGLEAHPNLFYANLEYNTKTGVVTQLSTARVKGDGPSLLSEPPATSSALFVVKMEVVSDKNELIQSGWISMFRKVIESKDNILNLKIIASYIEKAIIRISLPSGKIIWTGIMQ